MRALQIHHQPENLFLRMTGNMLYSSHNSYNYPKLACQLPVGAQIMQEYQVTDAPAKVTSTLPPTSPDDARDCLQCLIIMYGETHIDTLAQLLNLTAYAETQYSHRSHLP